MCLNWKRAHFDAFATFLNINLSSETQREIYRVYMERMFRSTFSKASVFTCLWRKGRFSKCSTFKTFDGSLRVHKQKRNQNYAISNCNASLVWMCNFHLAGFSLAQRHFYVHSTKELIMCRVVKKFNIPFKETPPGYLNCWRLARLNLLSV